MSNPFDPTVDGDPFQKYLADISPIPLTEEWLVRFGFEIEEWEDKNYKTFKHPTFKATIKGNVTNKQVYVKIIGGTIGIQYVHRLMNLFYSITGEELKLRG